jgi:hypothetical protein
MSDEVVVEEMDDEAAPARPRWQRILIRVLVTLGVLVVLVVVAGWALLNYGGMSGSVYDPQIRQQYEQLAAAGGTPPIQKQFVIPIPGCTCHSKDPVLTEQHRYRRMSQCSSCHAR